ncbi:MAG: M14 family zinc carboxypeptidase [Bacteroidales bacterium]
MKSILLHRFFFLLVMVSFACPALSQQAQQDRLARNSVFPYSAYPSYSEYETLMLGYAQQYPDICRLDTFATLPSGRHLLLLVIDDSLDVLQAEPLFLYTSTMHGDETGGYILMLNLIDTLLSSYGHNPRLTNLVNKVKIVINPLANPDGTYAGGNHTVLGATRYNGSGIDLNRNFPDPEDGPHPDGNVWQAETKAFMALADSLGFHMSANMHAGVEVVNYPWDTWSQTPADESWWLLVAQEYADTARMHGPVGYFSSSQFPDGVTNGYDWYSINGGRQDYMNYFQYCREMTLELSNQKIVSETDLTTLWDANRRSLLNYLEQATYGLSGVITDSLSGHPLKARVYITNFDVDSSHVYSRSADGYYHRYLAAGNYTLTYSAPGYLSRNISLNILDYHLHNLNVQLVPEDVSLASENYNRFKVYPNPTSYSITIRADFNSSQMIRVRLTDVTGKTMKKWEFNSANENVSFPLEDIPSGFYFIHLTSDHADYTEKIIIQ